MVGMKIYQSKASQIPGTSYKDVCAVARREHNKIENSTKRNPYVRSTYFTRQKIFISPLFWNHLSQKHLKNQTKRLKLYNAAIDLMRKSRCEPDTVFDGGNKSVLLHRFYGVTKDKVEFCVQVKENKRTGRKDFMSVFDKKLS
jgi:hypothetical protein